MRAAGRRTTAIRERECLVLTTRCPASAHCETRAGARQMRVARVKRVMRSAPGHWRMPTVLGAEARDDPLCDRAMRSLRALTRGDLRIVEPWFRDPDTRRFLGGPEWPRRMLELGEGVVGQEFRGAIQTGAYRYIAHTDGDRVGYVDCGTFN